MGLGSGLLGSIINYIIVIFVLLIFIFIIYTKIQDYKKGKDIFTGLEQKFDNKKEEKIENAKYKLIK